MENRTRLECRSLFQYYVSSPFSSGTKKFFHHKLFMQYDGIGRETFGVIALTNRTKWEEGQLDWMIEQPHFLIVQTHRNGFGQSHHPLYIFSLYSFSTKFL